MATTKAILAQQIIRRLSGGEKRSDSELDRREVMRLVAQAINEKIKENFFENYKLGEPGVEGQYIATYKNVAVLKDTDTNEFYSILPSNYAALPKGRGIRQVSPMKNQRVPFIIRENGNQGIYNTLPAGKLEGRIGVYPEGLRLNYTSDMDKAGVKKVLIKIAVGAPDSLAEGDPLPIDSSAEFAVIERVLGWLKDPAPIDKINNDNPQA